MEQSRLRPSKKAKLLTGLSQSAASAGMGCCGLNPENTDDVEERKRQNKANKEIEKQVSPPKRSGSTDEVNIG